VQSKVSPLFGAAGAVNDILFVVPIRGYGYPQMSPKKKIEVSASIHSTKAFDKSLILWNLQKKRKKKKKKRDQIFHTRLTTHKKDLKLIN
jgi:hypothetical protein